MPVETTKRKSPEQSELDDKRATPAVKPAAAQTMAARTRANPVRGSENNRFLSLPLSTTAVWWASCPSARRIRKFPDKGLFQLQLQNMAFLETCPARNWAAKKAANSQGTPATTRQKKRSSSPAFPSTSRWAARNTFRHGLCPRPPRPVITRGSQQSARQPGGELLPIVAPGRSCCSRFNPGLESPM